MLIEVFEAERSRIRWYYLIAYLLPLIIVGVSAAIFPYGYGTERYCWLKQDNNFIYSFVGPVIVVIVVSNIVYNGRCKMHFTFIEFYFLVKRNISNDGNCINVSSFQCLDEK